MNYVAIIFARYNSKRLPGKVLFNIGETCILGIVVEKLRRIKGLKIVVATSKEHTDDPIEAWCKKNEVNVFRGALDNVADRTANCLQNNPCDAFFRINADSPFLQVDLLTKAIRVFEQDDKIDLVTNVLERSYPYGIAVELTRSNVFIKQAKNFTGDEQEHITSYFYKNRQNFYIKNLKNDEDLSAYKFVLDTPEEWKEIQELYQADHTIFDHTISQLITINKTKIEKHLFDPSKRI